MPASVYEPPADAEDGLAASLRGLGPLGLLAVVIVLLGNAVFVPLRPPVPSVVSAAAQRKDDANPSLKELLSCCRSFQSPTKHLRKVRGMAVVTTKRARIRQDRS
jgi:hypothetical protein